MDATVRTPVVTAALLLSVCLACFTALLPARAQLTPAGNDLPEEPNIELDVDALLNNSQVFEDSVNSSIWSIAAQPGRRIIQIPIIVKPKTEETRLGTPSIKLRAGRFIAWRIVPDEADNNRNSNRYESEAAYDPYSNPTSVGSLRNYGDMGLGQIDQPGLNESSNPAQMGQPLTDDIPLLTRDITVSPQGVIHWELERAIPGGELKSGDTGYLLKLRPDRLNELRPEPPGRNTRSTTSRSSRSVGGEAPTGRSTTTRRPSATDSREAAARQREEQLEYREKLNEYNDLREHIRELPDEFQAPMPSRLWAIYEVSDRMDELEFTGEPPLPWTIKEADIQALKTLASRSSGGGNLTTEDFTIISQMTIMLANEHPLTERTVASSLSAAGMLGRSQQGDALYRLIARLLKSNDPQTVQITAAGLAASVPPSPATVALLRGAFNDLDPASKLMALGGLLTTEGNDPIAQRQMVDTANQIIADPNGPGVVHVLGQLVQALANNPDAIQLVGASIKFDDLQPEELDQAIVYIAEAAGDSPLASEWMEHGLLGSTNPQTVKRTVELLATSTRGNGIISRITRSMITATFGPGDPTLRSRETTQMQSVARIPINSTGHSIYRVLNAGDPELRSLGWQALRHFQVPAENTRGGRSPMMDPGVSEQTDRLALILNAAFNETVTPPQLVSFLVNQEDTEPATEALVRIVVEGRGPAITRAARALVRSGRRIDQSLQQLTPEQRGTFASRLYEAVTGSSPMVAGLMRINDSRSRVVGWFAQQVTTTGLPQPSEWASAMNGEDALLGLAASADPELADAAVASLVASVGGDEVVARDLARQMSSAADRSPSGLEEVWSNAKQEIYAGKLKSAAGSYRLILNIRGNSNSNGNTGYDMPVGYDYGGYDNEYGGEYGEFGNFGPDPSTELANADRLPLIKSINVALIELRADGQTIELVSGTLTLIASDQRLAIVMQDPKELNDFGNNEVSELPIENLDSPIQLLPQPGNAWRGATPLGDGRTLEVIFDPQ